MKERKTPAEIYKATDEIKKAMAANTGQKEKQVDVSETFEDYMREARDKFVMKVNSYERSIELRVACENLLICFDQMREKLTTPTDVPTEDWQKIISIMLDTHVEYLPKHPPTHEDSELYMIMAKRICRATPSLPHEFKSMNEITDYYEPAASSNVEDMAKKLADKRYKTTPLSNQIHRMNIEEDIKVFVDGFIAGYAASQPQPHESIEDREGAEKLIESAGEACMLIIGAYEGYMNGERLKDVAYKMFKYAKAGYKAAAAKDGQAERMFSLKEMIDCWNVGRRDGGFTDLQTYFKTKFNVDL